MTWVLWTAIVMNLLACGVNFYVAWERHKDRNRLKELLDNPLRREP